jgi:hypothetical protein
MVLLLSKGLWKKFTTHRPAAPPRHLQSEGLKMDDLDSVEAVLGHVTHAPTMFGLLSPSISIHIFSGLAEQRNMCMHLLRKEFTASCVSMCGIWDLQVMRHCANASWQYNGGQKLNISGRRDFDVSAKQADRHSAIQLRCPRNKILILPKVVETRSGDVEQKTPTRRRPALCQT